jgi:hypothetical protein
MKTYELLLRYGIAETARQTGLDESTLRVIVDQRLKGEATAVLKTDDQIREEAKGIYPPDIIQVYCEFEGKTEIVLNENDRSIWIEGAKWYRESAQSSMEAEIQKLKNHIDWQESRLEKERKDNDEVRSTQSKMIDKLLSKCDTLEIEIDRRANEKAKQMIEEMFEMLYSQRNKCKQFLNPSEGENQ